MLKELKRSNEIVFHMESQSGYYAVDHKIKAIDFTELEDVETLKYILEHGSPVNWEMDIKRKTRGSIYEYNIYNNGDYEFAERADVYSTQYLSRKEFEEFCEKAQESIKKRNPEDEHSYKFVHKIAWELIRIFPDVFLQIADGQGFNSYEWSD